MNSRRFFILWISLWCLGYVAEVQCYKALLFDRTSMLLRERDPNDFIDECYQCITACPDIGSQKENILNQYASISGNGVFLRSVHNSNGFVYTRTIETDICNQQLTPAIVWDRTDKDFKIGYELFYDKEAIDLSFYEYAKYVKVLEDGAPAGDRRARPNNSQISSHNNGGKFSFTITNFTPDSVFYWINVMSVDVVDSGHTRVIAIKNDMVNDYFHGAPVISINKCNSYFSPIGRMQIYEGSNNAGHQTNLIKTPIVPMRMFHSLSARLATCTYLNTAFIIGSIATGQLKKVDLYLYSMYREFPNNIKITFGVSGESAEYNVTELDELHSSEDTLFEMFPVQKVIFRIVELQWNGDVFDAAIVIHNNNFEVPEEDLICPETEWQQSWEDITSDTSRLTSGLTYVCRMFQNIANKLGTHRRVPPSYFFTLSAFRDRIRQRRELIINGRIDS